LTNKRSHKQTPLKTTSPHYAVAARVINVPMLHMSLVVRVLYAENRDWPKFDAFVRERLSALLPTLTFPSDGTVFDYFIDPQRAVCVRWNERSLEKLRYVAVSSSYVVIPEVLLFTVIFYN